MPDSLGDLTYLYRLVVGVFAFIGIAATVFAAVTGVGPVLWRLGTGLSKRKIGIFAREAQQTSLSNMLVKSKLFSEKRITRITSEADFGDAEGIDVFLVYWPDWQQNIDEIIRIKKEATALIIFAPQSEPRVPPEVMASLENKRNVVLSNLRGRLMNDVVLSMITSGYETK